MDYLNVFLNRVSHRHHCGYLPREGDLIFQEDFLRIKDQWKMAHRHDVQYRMLYVRHVDNKYNERGRIHAEVAISMLT